MQRSPLRELDCFGECCQVSSRLESFRSLRSPELRWGSYVSSSCTSSQDAQCTGCSRPPLNLESHHAEASTPRARLFNECRQASSRSESFRGLRSPESASVAGLLPLLGVIETSARQSSARTVMRVVGSR